MLETDKRYEVCVRHHHKGVVHLDYFDDLNAAHNFLLKRWEKLPRTPTMQTDYGAAIFDQQDGRKRKFLIGAEYVFEKVE